MSAIDRIPPDKARHFLAGTIVATLAACAAALAGLSALLVACAAVAAAVLIGSAKEVMDARANKRATDKWFGDPRGTPHGVEWHDALATAMGAAPVALTLIAMKGQSLWTS